MRKIMLTQGDKCVGFNLQTTPIEMLIINKALEQIKNPNLPDGKVIEDILNTEYEKVEVNEW